MPMDLRNCVDHCLRQRLSSSTTSASDKPACTAQLTSQPRMRSHRPDGCVRIFKSAPHSSSEKL